MYHRVLDVKAQISRPAARSPKKAKAAVRASSVTQPTTAKPKSVDGAATRAKTTQSVKAARPAAGSKARVAVPAKAKAASKIAPPAEPGAVTASSPSAASSKSAASKSAAAKRTAPTPLEKPAAAKRAAQARPSTSPAATPEKAAAAELAPPPAKKPARKSIKEAAGVSTDAVARRTGKTWDDWFEVLDSAGAATLDQRGIIAILAQKHGIGPWWQQMIAVGYESLRGKSDKPAAPDGFQINSSCTLDAPVTRVFRLWNDAAERARWLADDRFIVRAATADKVIRARWGKGHSHVAVSFNEKSGQTVVTVDHQQIESRGAAEQMKAYWAKKLGLLDEALAPRRP